LIPVAGRASSRRLPWPKRVDIALLCFLAILIAYCDRVNLSVAAPTMLREYGWNTAQMGWAFTGFFIGYTLFMIPAGRLADRFGPRHIFVLGIVWWSVFTALTPLPRTLGVFVAVRILMGLGESFLYPSINSTLVRWFPQQEYSRVAGFCWSGGYAGSILAFPLASAILALWGWRAVFFLFAGLGLIWLPFWWFGARDQPEDSPGITAEELAYIAGARPAVKEAVSAPWKRLFRLPALWAAWILHFSSNWYAYVMLTWLPTYLSTARGFSLADMAFGAALPFACALAGTNVFGPLIDRLSRGRNRTGVRKWFLAPYAVSAATLFVVPLAPGPAATVSVLSVSMFFLSAVTPVYASSSLDLAPRYAGTVVGIQNAFANLAGIIAPVLIGYLVKDWGWNSAFWITALMCTAGILTYLAFGKAEKLID